MLPGKYSHLKIQRLDKEFVYVLFEDSSQMSQAILSLSSRGQNYFAFSFEGESSLICLGQNLDFRCKKSQDGWMGFRIVGDMPFGTVQGLISHISSTLQLEQIGVCVVSTFETDLFLVKKLNLEKAVQLLNKSGWSVVT